MHSGVWALATAAATTLSWFGVRSVLHDTAYGPPRTLPIAVRTSPPAISSATHSPKPKPPPKSPSVPHRSAPASATPSTSAPPSASAPPPNPAGDVHSYTTAGGQVVLDLGASSASLVSATPRPGWGMQVWTSQPGWLRVTFTSASGTAASSVFCTWNGHPPTVQAYDN
ncbi:hypothetical protein SAMN05216259_107114 [Actinacidiphila guanduensis]|uniref:Secreted protein n=1 Tax=Actinacidiphila guanduensis TaxID=310781 RepID=A0A1H0GGJ6_9ACTN|nr:hypothetical protein SAMN05216259_107114 [Actinacidiphila guanduensis]